MVVLAMVSGALLAPHAEAQTSRSVWDGIYTEAQAARGAEDFAQVCASCHGPTLGGMGEAPALSGGQLVGDFDGQTVGDIFDRIRTTMPANAPGVLERSQYADVLAFLLKANGFPAGNTELDQSSETLKAIGFTASKP